MNFQREFPMSIEEFHRMPWRLGWKHEYFDDHAYLTPSYVSMDVYLPVPHCPPATRDPQNSQTFWNPQKQLIPRSSSRRPHLKDAGALVALFYSAFRPSVEFFGYSNQKVHAEAKKSIRGYFEGEYGKPLSCSRVFIHAEHVVGAMLLVDAPTPPFVRLLMVEPELQRRGIAAVLLEEVTAELRGSTELRSQFLVANEPSRLWHARMGFVEDPDALARSHYRNFYRHEIGRLRQNPGADPNELRLLEGELEKWSRLAAEAGLI